MLLVKPSELAQEPQNSEPQKSEYRLNLAANDQTESPADTSLALNQLKFHRLHPVHNCLVYLWCAQGFERKTEAELWTVYLEYRDRSGASRYSAKQFPNESQVREFVRHGFSQASLPDLCPTQCRQRPIGF